MQDLKAKILKRIEEIEAEQTMHETCRMVCIGVKTELNNLLNDLEEKGEDEDCGENENLQT